MRYIFAIGINFTVFYLANPQTNLTYLVLGIFLVGFNVKFYEFWDRNIG